MILLVFLIKKDDNDRKLLLWKFDSVRVRRQKEMQKCIIGASLESVMGLFESSDGA